MADFSIRGLDDEAHAALRERAAADGKSFESWVREQLLLLAQKPSVRKRYRFTALGENGAKITIERQVWADDPIRHGADRCSQEQFDAYQKAVLHVKRNEIGDYEAAYKLLLGAFDEVFAL